MQTFDPILHVLEAAFTSTRAYTDPIRDVALSATFTEPNGAEVTTPAFWDGSDTWRVRFSPPVAGEWHFVTHASDPTNGGLHGQSGSFTAPHTPVICPSWPTAPSAPLPTEPT